MNQNRYDKIYIIIIIVTEIIIYILFILISQNFLHIAVEMEKKKNQISTMSGRNMWFVSHVSGYSIMNT